MTCISLGIIIGVTKKEEEIAAELEDKEKREEALQRMIDAQIAREQAAEAALVAMANEENGKATAEDYSIEESVSSNPMNAVLKKK